MTIQNNLKQLFITILHYKPNLEYRDGSKQNALMMTLHAYDLFFTEYLLQQGARIEPVERFYDSILFFSIYLDQIEHTRLLLTYGANVYAKHASNITAFDYYLVHGDLFSRHNDIYLVHLLLDYMKQRVISSIILHKENNIPLDLAILITDFIGDTVKEEATMKGMVAEREQLREFDKEF